MHPSEWRQLASEVAATARDTAGIDVGDVSMVLHVQVVAPLPSHLLSPLLSPLTSPHIFPPISPPISPLLSPRTCTCTCLLSPLLSSHPASHRTCPLPSPLLQARAGSLRLADGSLHPRWEVEPTAVAAQLVLLSPPHATPGASPAATLAATLAALSAAATAGAPAAAPAAAAAAKPAESAAKPAEAAPAAAATTTPAPAAATPAGYDEDAALKAALAASRDEAAGYKVAGASAPDPSRVPAPTKLAAAGAGAGADAAALATATAAAAPPKPKPLPRGTPVVIVEGGEHFGRVGRVLKTEEVAAKPEHDGIIVAGGGGQTEEKVFVLLSEQTAPPPMPHAASEHGQSEKVLADRLCLPQHVLAKVTGSVTLVDEASGRRVEVVVPLPSLSRLSHQCSPLSSLLSSLLSPLLSPSSPLTCPSHLLSFRWGSVSRCVASGWWRWGGRGSARRDTSRAAAAEAAATCVARPRAAVAPHGQSGRLGGARSGPRGLMRLHLKAWGCPKLTFSPPLAIQVSCAKCGNTRD